MTAERDCMHGGLRIEPDAYVCSRCGARFERKPAEVHIAEMRERLRHGRKLRPVEEPDEDGT